MSTLNIKNCHVTLSSASAALECELGGARYHVWLNEGRSVQRLLFKNLPLGVKPGSAEDFATRTLSITSRFGAKLVAAMLARMHTEGLYEKAAEEYAHTIAKEKEDQRLAQSVHFVVGADREGRIYLVADDGALRQDIREAAVFTEHGLEQAVAIANQPDMEQRRRCTQLAVITLTAGDLERLTLEQTSST